MLISLPPVITKGEAKTTLFPWYGVSTSRTLRCPNAGRNCWQNGNIFFVVDLTMSITVPVSHLTG
ncbi:Uncharacterised protein [Escherichia coli]|uniref:Uncharacterized protein n=1 Tax=Escherichia coli TaxID=562 RepID=A0A2X1IU26_ECOLX|nr:Uncharacterised protein [Escherichia coli]